MLSILVISRSHANMEALIRSVADSDVDERLEVLVSWNSKEPAPLFGRVEGKVGVNYYQIMPYNFARNNNALARHASGEHLLFLNDDIVLDRHALARALAEIRKNGVGIVGANLRYADDTVQHAGIFFDEGGRPYHRHKHQLHCRDPRLASDEFVPAVTGAFLLIRKCEFDAIRFDERFAVAGEDVFLCLAYRRRFGRGVLYCAAATAIHLENVTRRETEERETPAGDLALIRDGLAADVGGVPLSRVRRPKVRIVTEKAGWIMHRKADEIRRHFGDDYVKINEDWPEAEIHYYINYGYFNKRPARGIVVANFTHFDPDALADKFIDVAFTVDHCTSVSELTSVKLRELGVPSRKITTIRVGADASFRPKLMLGIAGRPYRGGRKGEDLLQGLLDDPDIMEHCRILAVNPDWGLPTLASTEAADFYRLIDFLLVTARIEGGPVPFMEALACGTMAVAPGIGVIPEFPHVPYETGSLQSLKEVLHRLVAEMHRSRGLIASRMSPQNWSGWSVRHEKVFRDLLPQGVFT